ncbi:MAG TPA: MFS transporter [Streptosporangiaceae bacterium]
MKELFKQRDFRRLLIGQAVSLLGDWTGTLALMYFVLELSGSTTAVGGILVLRLLPSAVGGPLAAQVVSRWNRRRVMLASDLVRAGMAIALPVLPWLAWVYFWAFAIEVVGLVFLPARDAAIPLLISGKDEAESDARTLSLANGITMGASYGMIPVGAGLFGLILLVSRSAGWGGHWQYVVVFWLNALSYLVSYAAVRTIPDLGPRPSEYAEAGRAEGEGSRGESGRAEGDQEKPAQDESEQDVGMLAALRIPVVRAVLPATAVVALGLGALFSLGVVFVRDVLNAGPVGFGALVALFGVGAAGGLALQARTSRRGNLLATVRLSTATQGIVIATMGAIAATAWAFLGAVLFGAAATVALVSAITYLQQNLAGVRRNLGLTAFHACLRFALAMAALAAGAAADLLNPFHLVLFGTVAPAQAVLAASGLVVVAGSLLVRGGTHGADDRPRAAREDRSRR